MFKLNNEVEEGQWFDYPKIEGIKFKIRPTSLYALKKTPGESIEIDLTDMPILFDYVLMDWKGIGDEKGKQLKCNQKTKLALLNQAPDMVTFVLETAGKMRSDTIPEEEVKN